MRRRRRARNRTESDDGAAARLREPGDAVAVHNPTGWVLPYAEVRLLVGRRVKVVDARTGRAVPTQERRTDGVRFLNGLLRSRADGEEDDEIDGLTETVAALNDLPPLGIVRLAAVAVGDEMKTDDDDDDGRYAKAPRRDPAVTFESDGTAAVGGVKMSVASVASPADERFGDGPYVSRSGLWHVLPVVVGALVCFVNVTFAAWVAARALGKRRGARGGKDEGASSTARLRSSRRSPGDPGCEESAAEGFWRRSPRGREGGSIGTPWPSVRRGPSRWRRAWLEGSRRPRLSASSSSSRRTRRRASRTLRTARSFEAGTDRARG